MPVHNLDEQILPLCERYQLPDRAHFRQVDWIRLICAARLLDTEGAPPFVISAMLTAQIEVQIVYQGSFAQYLRDSPRLPLITAVRIGLPAGISQGEAKRFLIGELRSPVQQFLRRTQRLRAEEKYPELNIRLLTFTPQPTRVQRAAQSVGRTRRPSPGFGATLATHFYVRLTKGQHPRPFIVEVVN